MARLEVGRVIRPHGVRGEVVVELVSNRPDERMAIGSRLSTHVGELEVVAARPHQARWIVSFAGVTDRNGADKLRGVVLEAEPLDDADALWVHELVGARVYDTAGLFYGTVREVEANPASDLLVLPDGLVPLTFVVTYEPGRIVIDPPEGLIDPCPPIEVVDYDPSWPRQFDDEVERLRSALGDVAVRIEHVGSTSVRGLAAKPVIDVQLSVTSLEPMQAYRKPLERLGYEWVPDPATPAHRLFQRGRDVNLHVCEAGSAWESENLAFRDLLRADADARDEYAALKRTLAAEHGNDVESYADAKGEFIRAHR